MAHPFYLIPGPQSYEPLQAIPTLSPPSHCKLSDLIWVFAQAVPTA